jgi:hypothetical protein
LLVQQQYNNDKIEGNTYPQAEQDIEVIGEAERVITIDRHPLMVQGSPLFGFLRLEDPKHKNILQDIPKGKPKLYFFKICRCLFRPFWANLCMPFRFVFI